MANWCSNFVEMDGPEQDLKQIWNILKGLKETCTNKHECTNVREDTPVQNNWAKQLFSFDDYLFNLDLGTSFWNNFSYNFSTKWGPEDDLILELSERYPEVEFKLLWEVDGDAGLRTYEEGVMVCEDLGVEVSRGFSKETAVDIISLFYIPTEDIPRYLSQEWDDYLESSDGYDQSHLIEAFRNILKYRLNEDVSLEDLKTRKDLEKIWSLADIEILHVVDDSDNACLDNVEQVFAKWEEILGKKDNHEDMITSFKEMMNELLVED
jgi:hypothetical protein